MQTQRKYSICGGVGHNSRGCTARPGTVAAPPASAEEGGASDRTLKRAHSGGNACSESDSETEQSAQRKERKRGNPWTKEEHRRFLAGLRKLGKGNWRGISKHFVQSRTSTQVASHAQKYFIRQLNLQNRKRRSSLFDMAPDPDSDTAKSTDQSPEQPAGMQGSGVGIAAGSRTSSFEQGRADMDGAQAHFPGHQQQDDGQRHAALMQSLMQAAAAGMGQPMMQMGMARPPGMPGQQGLPMQQQGFIPFLPYGGFAPPQPTPQQMAQAMMQQQAAAAMFGNGQPGMPALGNGQPDRMFPPSGMEQAMAMRNMQFAQAMAAMMGFQSGGGMPFNAGGPFQGGPRPMLFGQAGFSGPPSPGNVSAVGSVANAAVGAEHGQRAGSPGPELPSGDSGSEGDGREQCTFDEQMQRQQEGRQHTADAGKMGAARMGATSFVPEQQPEGPLGIENALAGAKQGFSNEHSGHGRLYRPQATLARPPVTGLPAGEIFAGGDGRKKAGGNGNSGCSHPYSALEPSQGGLSNSKRSTSDSISLGRLPGSHGLQLPFKTIEPITEQQR